MRQRKRMRQVFGTDADLFDYCMRRGKVNPALEVVSEFLDELKIQPDPAYPDHRDHLSDGEKVLLERLFSWVFGYRTHEEPLPLLSYWRAKLHKSVTHMRHMIRFLAGQGLLRIYNSCKPGLALHFSIDVLLDRVREWLGIKPKALPVPEEEQESMGAQAPIEPQPEPWADLEGEKQPIPFPQPEPEPEPLPEAAMVRAPEWDSALQVLQRKVSRSAYVGWLAQLRGWKSGDQFILQAPSSYGVEIVQRRWGDLIRHILEPMLPPSMELFITAEDMAARSAG